jgi:pimeloyl-ACP methyl ester carboxylesterase
MINQEVDEATMDLILKNKTTGARLSWKPRLFSPQLEKWLFRINIPTLIISGSHDNICPLDQSKLFNEKIEGSQLAIIENCGHLPHVEKTDEYCELITNFIME